MTTPRRRTRATWTDPLLIVDERGYIPVAVTAMLDRLVRHAEVIVLKVDSFRLLGKRQEVLTGEKAR